MNEKASTKIVGLVGDAATGKDTVAAVFEEYGYNHVSASDLLREEILKRGLIPSRELQTQIANDLRAQKGAAYFVEEVLSRLVAAPSYNGLGVVSGLYAPAEGEYLLGVQGALVEVTSDETDDLIARFNRLAARSDGSRDHMSLEEFRAAHIRENSGLTAGQANVLALRALARYKIVNKGSLADLRSQVEDIIKDL